VPGMMKPSLKGFKSRHGAGKLPSRVLLDSTPPRRPAGLRQAALGLVEQAGRIPVETRVSHEPAPSSDLVNVARPALPSGGKCLTKKPIRSSPRASGGKRPPDFSNGKRLPAFLVSERRDASA